MADYLTKAALWWWNPPTVDTRPLLGSLKWPAIYFGLFAAFYVYSSPFSANRVQRYDLPSWTYLSRSYTAWLGLASLLHVPALFASAQDAVPMALATFGISFGCLSAFMIVWRLVGFAVRHAARDWAARFQLRSALPAPSDAWLAAQNSALLAVGCSVAFLHCSVDHGHGHGRAECEWMLAGDHGLPPFVDARLAPTVRLWATGMAVLAIHFAFDRLETFADRREADECVSAPARVAYAQPMSNWYTASLLETAGNLVLAVGLSARFEIRQLLSAGDGGVAGRAAAAHDPGHGHGQGPHVFSHLAAKDHLWVDFMGDTGDGFSSTYAIARQMAQPMLRVRPERRPGAMLGRSPLDLPRADVAFVLGDLVYPHPTEEAFELRLARPFADALRPPPGFDPHRIADKTTPQLGTGPEMFLIPGNHDYLDQLAVYQRSVLGRSHLGGWRIPHDRPWFAVQLPHGWWVFAVDCALEDDIDASQYRYFAAVADRRLRASDRVILMSHRPKHILDPYYGVQTERRLDALLRDHVGARLALRVHGDVHNYQRHMDASTGVVNLVSGGGGAFLHPTHVFTESEAERAACFPSAKQSQQLCLANLHLFRRKNAGFDVVGGALYWLLVVSALPATCDLSSIFRATTWAGVAREGAWHVLQLVLRVLCDGWVSLAAFALLCAALVGFADPRLGRLRVFVGLLHAAVHLFAAATVGVLVFSVLAAAQRDRFVGTDNLHALYDSYAVFQRQHFPRFQSAADQLSLHAVPQLMRWVFTAFDLPNSLSVTATEVCVAGGVAGVARSHLLAYYGSAFAFVFLLSTPVAALVLGLYLFVCVALLRVHWDEGFSSLRLDGFKSFLRVHITRRGDLEVFCIGSERVPRAWTLDPLYSVGASVSKWMAARRADEKRLPAVVDFFVMRRSRS